MADIIARYPAEASVTAYGNGGFRFADMSHKGSILCMPSGVYAWAATTVENMTAAMLALPLSELTPPSVLLLGTGVLQAWPPEPVVKAFANAGIGLEVMSTGAAARTYNILLAERRHVGAALLAVP